MGESTNEGGTGAMSLRAAAMTNAAFLRVVHTAGHQQVAVMSIPPDGAIGVRRDRARDSLFVVVDGAAEGRVGSLVVPLLPGDVMFAEAGKQHDVINRTAGPLRLVTVSSPPAHAPGTLELRPHVEQRRRGRQRR